MSFAEKFLQLRLENGVSQEKLAEKFEISRQSISKWEMGDALPETDKLIAISDYFKVSIDYLLRDDTEFSKNEKLSHAVIRFLGVARDIDSISKNLIEVVKDGVIDDDEKEYLSKVSELFDDIIEDINEIRNIINR